MHFYIEKWTQLSKSCFLLLCVKTSFTEEIYNTTSNSPIIIFISLLGPSYQAINGACGQPGHSWTLPHPKPQVAPLTKCPRVGSKEAPLTKSSRIHHLNLRKADLIWMPDIFIDQVLSQDIKQDSDHSSDCKTIQCPSQ